MRNRRRRATSGCRASARSRAEQCGRRTTPVASPSDTAAAGNAQAGCRSQRAEPEVRRAEAGHPEELRKPAAANRLHRIGEQPSRHPAAKRTYVKVTLVTTQSRVRTLGLPS